MNLPKSIQSDLDFLIPPEIIKYCKFDRFDMELVLVGSPANGRYPWTKIWVDNQLVIDQQVVDSQQFVFSKKLDLSIDSVQIKIEYYNKTNDDTLVDSSGQILENQNLTISNIIINDIDIVETSIVYRLGNYAMALSPEKLEYYKQHGYSTEPTHSLGMYENGDWTLTIPLPVVTTFVRYKSAPEPHERWPNPGLLKAIYDELTSIRMIEKTLNETKSRLTK